MGLNVDPWLLCGALAVALAIDRLLGEPPSRWHPVVWMGHYLGWIGRAIAPEATVTATAAATEPGQPIPRDLPRGVLGALAWCLGAAVVVALALLLQGWVAQLPVWAGALLLGLWLKPMLAWRMLRREVLAVEDALAESLAAGRERLSWLVSRDVTTLTAEQVRESAIESLAENLNDSVVAPVFWFVLLGLPGAVLYRYANTADAMWGYRGVYRGRVWEWAGKWAARVDDLLSWLPARLTAALLLGWRPAIGGLLCRQARLTPSPNSGWPMVAMALRLGVCLHKPGVYCLNEAAPPPLAHDTRRAIGFAQQVVLLSWGWASLCLLLAWLLGGSR